MKNIERKKAVRPRVSSVDEVHRNAWQELCLLLA